MSELLSSIVIIGGIGLVLFGVVYGIPKWVVLSTESENDPNHIYSIFMKESGYRGHKILSAAGVLFPFILLTKPIINVEGLLFVTILSIICLVSHWSVYSDYPVFNTSMKVTLPSVLIALAAIALLTRDGHLSGSVYIFILVATGTAWGSYAVYRRSILIHETRQ